MTTTTAARIAELSRDALMASDEGTHGMPLTVSIYERLDGTRYGVRSHGGSPIARCAADAGSEHGRMRHFRFTPAAARRAEIARLEAEARAAAGAAASEERGRAIVGRLRRPLI